MYRLTTSSFKAGLDEERRQQITERIYRLSKDSRFYRSEQRKDEKTQQRVQKLILEFERLRRQRSPDHDLPQKNHQSDSNLAHVVPSNTRMDFTWQAEMRCVEARVRLLERERDLSRQIVHLDMDAFYVSVEMRDRPELQGRAVAVGDMHMLSTSNYEARKFGVRSALPGFIAMELCPDLVILPPNFSKYRAVSEQVQTILAQFDPNFDMMSLDEGYLDVTEYCHLHTDRLPELVVQELRSRVFEMTGLTCSAGLAANRILAKIASDINKPNGNLMCWSSASMKKFLGQFYLENDRDKIMDFVRNLPVRKVSGIGKVTEKVLSSIDIVNCQQLFDNRFYLYKLFSPSSFDFLLRVSLGIGSNAVGGEDWNPKSISIERTFSSLSDPVALRSKLKELSDLLEKDVRKKELKGRTITLKLKTSDFDLLTRSKTLADFVNSSQNFYATAEPLLNAELPISLRLMGVRLSGFAVQDEKQPHITDYFRPVSVEQLDNFSDEDDLCENDNVDVEHEPDFTCPVCMRVVRGAALNQDNSLFNAHVDVCLNRDAIRSFIQEFPCLNQLPMKRKPEASKEPSPQGMLRFFVKKPS